MAKLALRSNRKFRRLLAMVRVDSPEHLRGHLSALWETTWENGTPLIGDFQDIEAAAGWSMPDVDKYPPGALAAALVMARLVDVVVEGELYAVHDWYEHAPEYVKKRIGRAVKEDPTVCAETFFLGLEVWARRAAEIGLDVHAVEDLRKPAEILSRDLSGIDFEDDLPEAEQEPNRQEVSARRPKPSSYSKTAAEVEQFLENGSLSSQAKASRAETSQERTSPPRSPSPSFSTDLSPGERSAAELRDAIHRVNTALDRLDRETAAFVLAESTRCRTLADWTALADVAGDALESTTHPSPLEMPA